MEGHLEHSYIFLRDPQNFLKWVVPTNSHAHTHMGMRNNTRMMDWKGGDFFWWKNECVNSFFKWLKLSALVWRNDMKLMIEWKGMGIWWDNFLVGMIPASAWWRNEIWESEFVKWRALERGEHLVLFGAQFVEKRRRQNVLESHGFSAWFWLEGKRMRRY